MPHGSSERDIQAGMIEALFPKEVVVGCSDQEADPGLLYPQEAECVRNAVPKRRLEFTQGRLCARRLLAGMGIRDFPLLARQDRSPIWPEGITGSISHCAGLCAVALARTSVIAGLGLDVEAAEPLEDTLLPLVCGAQERARLEQERESERGLVAKLLFSAKESVFKCVYPVTGVFLEFHHCRIEFPRVAGTFIAEITHQEMAPPWRGLRLEGRFARDSRHLFTGVALAPGDWKH